MFSRRSFFQCIPLPFLFGKAFFQPTALDQQAPADVARRLLKEVQTRSWEDWLASATPKMFKLQRRILDRQFKVLEQLGQFDELLEKLGFDERELRRASDRRLVAAWFQMIDEEFQAAREVLAGVTLNVIAEVREDRHHIHVVHRLESDEMMSSIRPNVLQLIYEDEAWQASFAEPIEGIQAATVVARRLPRLQIDVLADMAEQGMRHFLCRASCEFPNDSVAPMFCCTWGDGSEDAETMRSRKYAPLKQLLRKQILSGLKSLLENLPKVK